MEAYLAWDQGRPVEQALYLTVSGGVDLENSGITTGRLEVMDLREDITEE